MIGLKREELAFGESKGLQIDSHLLAPPQKVPDRFYQVTRRLQESRLLRQPLNVHLLKKLKGKYLKVLQPEEHV